MALQSGFYINVTDIISDKKLTADPIELQRKFLEDNPDPEKINNSLHSLIQAGLVDQFISLYNNALKHKITMDKPVDNLTLSQRAEAYKQTTISALLKKHQPPAAQQKGPIIYTR